MRDGVPNMEASQQLPQLLLDAAARLRERRAGLALFADRIDPVAAALFAGTANVRIADHVEDRGHAAELVEAADSCVVLAATPALGAVGAIGAFRRLVPDRFAFAAALRLVVASSTARRLCQHCREPVQAFGTLSAKLGFDSGAIVYRAAGCAACGATGESEDFTIYEVIELDSAMRRLTYESGDESLLARHAFLNVADLGAAARGWAREGMISAEEAVRVSRTSRPVTMMLG